MARSRNIKPAFFTNDDLGELKPLARLLFIGLWTIADHKGCFEYKPKRLKVQLLPYDDCDIEQLVISLEKSRFISIYSVQDQQYGKVLNFSKHQNPHKNERDKGSDIPDMPDNLEKNSMFSDNLGDIEINRDQNGSDRADSLNLIPDSCSLNTDSTVSVSPKFVFKTELKKLGVSDEAAAEFMQVRKVKKAVNTKNAFDQLVSESAKAKITLAQAVDYCLKRQNPWGAFKASWYANEQASTHGNQNQDQWATYFQNLGKQSELDVTPVQEIGHVKS